MEQSDRLRKTAQGFSAQHIHLSLTKAIKICGLRKFLKACERQISKLYRNRTRDCPECDTLAVNFAMTPESDPLGHAMALTRWNCYNRFESKLSLLLMSSVDQAFPPAMKHC